MKNLSISKKLSVGFGAVLALMLLSLTLSLISINNLGHQVKLYGKYTVPNHAGIWMIRRDIVSAERYMLQAFIEKDVRTMEDLFTKANEDGKEAVAELEKFAANQRDTDCDEKIKELRIVFQQAGAVRQEIASLIMTQTESNLQKAYELFNNEYAPLFEEATIMLADLSTTVDTRATKQKEESAFAEGMAWTTLMACAVVSIIFTFIVIVAIRNSILNPVKEIVDIFEEISKGHLQAEIRYESQDEMGQMAKLIQKTNKMQRRIVEDVIEKFTKISQGDLQIHVDIDYPGDFDALRQTIEKTGSNLNATMQMIRTAAEQVSTGASQLSSGAEALAVGSTEQASSVEELTVSIKRIAEQAVENSDNVKIAKQYVEQASAGVNAGNEHMTQLSEAMADIGSASNQIVNITKAIEDIAFQTNILALNAAIEAARAGSAGKGFAVVADEVRNLAAKSAKAAKQTGELIKNSAASISRGTQITTQTAQILQDVGKNTLYVTESFIKIEQASAEQAGAIEQIEMGLSQVSSVVQTNAATAEENSATSEEMSAQATALNEEVGKFKLNAGY